MKKYRDYIVLTIVFAIVLVVSIALWGWQAYVNNYVIEHPDVATVPVPRLSIEVPEAVDIPIWGVALYGVFMYMYFYFYTVKAHIDLLGDRGSKASLGMGGLCNTVACAYISGHTTLDMASIQFMCSLLVVLFFILRMCWADRFGVLDKWWVNVLAFACGTIMLGCAAAPMYSFTLTCTFTLCMIFVLLSDMRSVFKGSRKAKAAATA